MPTIALIYDTKVVELLKRTGNKHQRIFISINELDADKLKRVVNTVIN